MKKTIITLCFAFGVTTCLAQNLIEGVTNQIIWGKANTDDVTLSLTYQTSVNPVSLTIGLDNPNGIRAIILFKGLSVAVNLSDIMTGIDENDIYESGFYIQAATHDFDGDNNPEIIIAFGNGLAMSVNVLKFHSPTNTQDANKIENWKIALRFDAQDVITVAKQVITAPTGSQGLFDEYTWVNEKFVQTN